MPTPYPILDGKNHPGLISAFVIDAKTGRLGAPVNFPIETGIDPGPMVHDPANQFDYVADVPFSEIRVYSVNSYNGQLKETPGSPFATEQMPEAMAFTPDGQFLYVADWNANAVSAYAVDRSTGSLSKVSGSPFATTGKNLRGCCVAVTSDGRHVLAVDTDGLYSYRIDPKTGALTLVTAIAEPLFLEGMAVDPNGKYVYVVGGRSKAILSFSIDRSSGKLSFHASSPVGHPQSVSAIVVTPNRRFAYTVEDWQVTLYRLRRGKFSGAIQSWSGADGCTQLTVDPSGRFLIAPQAGARGVSVWAINQKTGTLNPVPNSPFIVSGPPSSVMAVRQ